LSKSSRKPMSEYVLSLSYGKDSTACLGAIKELGWPLHRIITADVWATDTIPADPPPMVEFKAKLDAYILKEFGIQVEHLCAMRNGEKLTYEKLFYHIPKRKPKNEALGGGTAVSRMCSAHGATDTSKCQPCGFPYTVGSWCKKLKDGTYPRLPDPQGQLVYQRPQTPGFPVAPLHKERRQILCSTLGLQRMSQNGLNDTPSPGSYSLLWRSDGMRRIAVSGAKKEVSCPLSTPLQRGGGVLVLPQSRRRPASSSAKDLPGILGIADEVGLGLSHYLQGRWAHRPRLRPSLSRRGAWNGSH